MRIAAIAAHDSTDRCTISLPEIKAALTGIFGPSGSGKTAVADLVGHALFGKHRVAAPGHLAANGELIVEDRDVRYRVRASHDPHGHTRLTVAALDPASSGARSPIDHLAIRRLTGNLPPSVLTPLCAVGFHRPPDIGRLLSPEFAAGFQSILRQDGQHGSSRVAELAARRDLLAQELETRIATERRASKDLEARWRELDRLVREEQHQAAGAEQRLKAVENSLAETDARLRYRRLELNVELRWQTSEAPSPEPPADLGAQILRCRQILAELNERELAVRASLAQLQSTRKNSASVLAEQQTWLAVSRQLAADLTGEVARLARASASQKCVCRDAHPRLRPIAETIDRQLAVLEKSIHEQRRALTASELEAEVNHLTRTQVELRGQLEHLLDRSQLQPRGTAIRHEVASDTTSVFSAADAEQLESRRMELEHERFQLVEQVNSAARKLKVLRGERDAIERQRAAILSARSMEHVQRELAVVQKKLENAATDTSPLGDSSAADYLVRASDFLAQLTSGDITRLIQLNHDRNVAIVNHHGEAVPLESLTPAQHDQVYLSLCLALLSAASRHGVWLPLVLDEPFERLDARGTAALAAVLDSFSRQGNQVLVFTRQKEAAERLAAIGAEVHDIMNLRQSPSDTRSAVAPVLLHSPEPRRVVATKRSREEQPAEVRRRKRKSARRAQRDSSADAGHSDAA